MNLAPIQVSLVPGPNGYPDRVSLVRGPNGYPDQVSLVPGPNGYPDRVSLVRGPNSYPVDIIAVDAVANSSKFGENFGLINMGYVYYSDRKVNMNDRTKLYFQLCQFN